MRVLAGADFHGNLGIVGWFVERARELVPEAVVLAGDLLGFADEVEDDFEDQKLNAEQVVAKLLEIEVPIFYIMGNDDLIELAPVEGRLVPVHNRRVELGNFNFVGYQYTLPFMGGDLEKPEAEIEKDLEAIERLIDDRTVLGHSFTGLRNPGSRCRTAQDREPLLAGPTRQAGSPRAHSRPQPLGIRAQRNPLQRGLGPKQPSDADRSQDARARSAGGLKGVVLLPSSSISLGSGDCRRPKFHRIMHITLFLSLNGQVECPKCGIEVLADDLLGG